VGSGALTTRLRGGLDARATVITAVDQSRDALSVLDDAPATRGVGLVQQRASLAEVALGRARLQLDPQDVIVIDGALEYLPSRVALSLLRTCATSLRPEGSLVLSALEPSDDAGVVDLLLGWPTIRRAATAMEALVASAGLVTSIRPDPVGPGLVVTARR
jgi:2-polyprenyl-3-methyl-5-hydroxy-6-metoxy-1,4-benzoquinol methylase